MSTVSALARRATFVDPRSDWIAVGSTLWVAVSSGLHQGRVEGHGGSFVAIDDANQRLGEFSSLRDAMFAVETDVTTSPVAA